MGLAYDVPEYKRIRVIIDRDAACEADDPFAIAHALMSKKLEVRAIFAEHFGAFGTVKKSYEEIKTIVSAMKIDVPILMGRVRSFPGNQRESCPRRRNFPSGRRKGGITRPFMIFAREP